MLSFSRKEASRSGFVLLSFQENKDSQIREDYFLERRKKSFQA